MSKNYYQSSFNKEDDGVSAGRVFPAMDGRKCSFLCIFDGPTGAGKSAVLEYLRKEYSGPHVIGAKLTTRPKRPNEKSWDLRFVESIPRTLSDFSYSSVGWQYAVNFDEVKEALEAGLSYFTICTDVHVIRALASHFLTVVIYIHRVLLPHEVSSLLAVRETTTPEESHLRLAEVEGAVTKYADNIGLYDYVVLNIGTISDLHAQIDAIILDYRSSLQEKN